MKFISSIQKQILANGYAVVLPASLKAIKDALVEINNDRSACHLKLVNAENEIAQLRLETNTHEREELSRADREAVDGNKKNPALQWAPLSTSFTINSLDFIQPLFCFNPLYKERIWGGTAFAGILGRPLPARRKIGESWDIVDRPEAQSVVCNNPFSGLTLREVIFNQPELIMGPEWPAEKPFPVLVKWLDCTDRLSLQVHPPLSVASGLGGEPKSKNWYVAHAKDDAQLILGFKEPVHPDDFSRALNAGRLEQLVNHMPVKAGDSIFVHSGQVHAIDRGNLILEIQQNSDTTYRVSDWGRVDQHGKPRELHLRQAMRSITWDGPSPQLFSSPPPSTILAHANEFRVSKQTLALGATLRFMAGEQPRILSVVSGALVTPSGELLSPGTNALIPYSASLQLTAAGPTEVLITDLFV